MINIVVTTCGEEGTVDLIEFLDNSINKDDYKLWVLTDDSKAEENYDKIVQACKYMPIERGRFPLDDNFAEFRNSIHTVIPEGDWVFHLDADEMVNKEFLKIMPPLLKENPSIDLYYLPRNNYVNGITQEYIEKMGWNMDSQGRINYPDWQGRLYQYKEGVRWKGKVHEKVVGINNYGMLKEDWAHIEHIKDFDRQKKQNEYYEKLEE